MTMLPNYEDIVDLLKKGSTIEAQEKIMELREAAMELQEENLALREQVRTLEGKLALRGKIGWERPYYWMVEDGKRDGPFCQICYDKSSTLVRLQGGKNGRWACGGCGKAFYDATYVPPPPARAISDY